MASVIEARTPGDVAALAHHYDLAGTADTAAKAVRYAGLAGEQAERRYAYREAASQWERAINAYDRAGGRQIKERLELQVRTIHALALAGDMTAARAHRRDAMDVALPLGDLELTARVAAALAVPHKGIARDFTRTAWEIVDVTEKALLELPPSEHSLRASLLATLALELEGSATPRGEQASLEAEELARASGDPNLLAMALERAVAPVLHAGPGRRARGHRARAARGRRRVGPDLGADPRPPGPAGMRGGPRRLRRGRPPAGARRQAGPAIRPGRPRRPSAPGTPGSAS